jgi:uroporphyrinogen-III synthase
VKAHKANDHVGTGILARPGSRSGQKLKALSGLRILVGRARHQASVLSSGFRKLGAEVIEIPFIEIRKPRSYRPLDSAMQNLRDYDWLILTSVNGVEAVWDRIRESRLARNEFAHLKVAAIGPATRKAIEGLGLRVDVVPKKYVAESVVEALRDRIAGKRVLVARAKIARDVIPRELRKLGAQVDVVEAYETVIPRASRTQLRAILQNPKRRPDVITFTSSSTVRNFMALLGSTHGRDGRAYIAGVKLASIGPVTSSTLRALGLPVDIEAKEYTIPGLINAIVHSHQP